MASALLIGGLTLVLPAAAATTPSVVSTAEYPVGLAEDSHGNIYIASEVNSGSGNIGLVVVPKNSGTLFGVAVTAGVEKKLTGNSSIRGVAIDSQDDVYYSLNNGEIYALTSTNRTVFGQSVSANTPTRIASGTSMGGGLQFDSLGNLFGIAITHNVAGVLPIASGTIFGVSVTANTPATVVNNSGSWFWDMTVDNDGNLIIADGWGLEGVWIMPRQNGTYYGQTVVANTFTRLTGFNSVFGKAAGIDSDDDGNLFIARYGDAIYMWPTASMTRFDQSLTANTLTRITSSVGYTDQGLTVLADHDLLSGGGASTYRISANIPAPSTPSSPATPSIEPSTSPTSDTSSASNLSAASSTNSTPAGQITISTKSIKFATSSSQLSQANITRLLKNKVQLQAAQSIQIVAAAGYLNGTSKSMVKNLALARARAIKKTLIANGIDRDRISIDLKVTKIGLIPRSKLIATQ